MIIGIIEKLAEKIKNESFIVLRLKKFLNKEDYYLLKYKHIYILGDIDFPKDEVESKKYLEDIKKIKELITNNPRVINYIPGYVDMCSINKDLTADSSKSYSFYDFIESYSEKEEYFKWIKELPIQIMITRLGKKYCIAPAFFDYKLYKTNKSYSLNDFEKEYNNDDEKMKSIIKKIFGYKIFDTDIDIKRIIPLGYYSIVGVSKQYMKGDMTLISKLFGKFGFPRTVYNIYPETVFGNGHFKSDIPLWKRLLDLVVGREKEEQLVTPTNDSPENDSPEKKKPYDPELIKLYEEQLNPITAFTGINKIRGPKTRKRKP